MYNNLDANLATMCTESIHLVHNQYTCHTMEGNSNVCNTRGLLLVKRAPHAAIEARVILLSPKRVSIHFIEISIVFFNGGSY
jgi:hypothetical protein